MKSGTQPLMISKVVLTCQCSHKWAPEIVTEKTVCPECKKRDKFTMGLNYEPDNPSH